MSADSLVSIRDLVDNRKCFETVRALRWPEGVRCPECGADAIIRQGRDDTQPERQRYRCKMCGRRFDDLTDTVFAGHHQPLRVWILCLYLMGLNLSNLQIADELDLNKDDVQAMCRQLREGIVAKAPEVSLSGVVECDEVYVVAGHKGHPEAVVKKNRVGRRRRLKGAPGRGTLEKEKPPVFGMIQRGGQVVIRMLADVRQTTIKPLITGAIASGTVVNTDEYGIYSRLGAWGYHHKSVCHGNSEYARDEDGDGFCEVHVNTIEGVWSLLRSWLRPHRGISQERLPAYLAFFQFTHNARVRGKALLPALLAAFLA